MKASIKIDKSFSEPRLHGDLGITNEAYTAILEVTRPDGKTDSLVVPSSNTSAWEVTLNNYAAGAYEARITPRKAGAFEATRLTFEL